MKYLAVVAMLAISGCAGVTPSDLTARAKQIQDYTRLACSFVPTISTIAAILSSGTSAAFTTIAADICAAVTTAPLADGPRRGPPKAYGVVIKGQFVK